MPLGGADTRAKLIDPALHARGWTEDLIRREETEGLRTPEELLDLIEAKDREVAEAVATLRSLSRPGRS